MGMARLIDADAFIDDIKTEIVNLYLDGMKGTPRPRGELYDIIDRIGEQPTVVAVPVEQYKSLLEMYNELRENFIDYVCSGVPNLAPYCLNKCEGCVDLRGWCKQDSDKCQGFNPAECII